MYLQYSKQLQLICANTLSIVKLLGKLFGHIQEKDFMFPSCDGFVIFIWLKCCMLGEVVCSNVIFEGLMVAAEFLDDAESKSSVW